MSILAKYNKALEAKDEAAMKEIIHDDYKFLMHASGKTLSKSDVIKWGMSGDINRDRVRIIYENDEIGVEHSFVTFKDGNTEAVMGVFKFKDGKVISFETGATKIPKKQKGNKKKKICLKLDYQWVVQRKDQSIKL